jgi:hypothetical protein
VCSDLHVEPAQFSPIESSSLSLSVLYIWVISTWRQTPSSETSSFKKMTVWNIQNFNSYIDIPSSQTNRSEINYCTATEFVLCVCVCVCVRVGTLCLEKVLCSVMLCSHTPLLSLRFRSVTANKVLPWFMSKIFRYHDFKPRYTSYNYYFPLFIYVPNKDTLVFYFPMNTRSKQTRTRALTTKFSVLIRPERHVACNLAVRFIRLVYIQFDNMESSLNHY